MSDTVKKTRREALEEFKRFSRAMQSVIDLGEYVESIEQLSQAATEAESRLAAAIPEAEKLRDEIAALSAERDAITARARDEAERMVSAARAAVETLTETAKRNAEDIRAAARADAENMVTTASKSRDVAERAAIAANSEADAARAMVANLRAEQAQIEEQIEKARAVVRNLMGS